MLMVVRDTDTASTLAARRRQMADELAALAAAPVRHVTPEFLQAVEGLFPELVQLPCGSHRASR
jgi:hypothetical protein